MHLGIRTLATTIHPIHAPLSGAQRIPGLLMASPRGMGPAHVADRHADALISK